MAQIHVDRAEHLDIYIYLYHIFAYAYTHKPSVGTAERPKRWNHHSRIVLIDYSICVMGPTQARHVAQQTLWRVTDGWAMLGQAFDPAAWPGTSEAKSNAPGAAHRALEHRSSWDVGMWVTTL